MSSRRIIVTSLLFLLLSLSLPGFATTILVPAGQPTIQAGINAAVAGDIVQVSAGTYYENINFSGKAITVTSASGPAATIIDGSKNSSATVTFDSNEKSTSVLSGFTLRGGSYDEVSISSASPTIKGNIILGSSQYYSYGIYIQTGSGTIQGNLISDASYGGIISYSGKGSKISGNIIANNIGVGIAVQYSSATDILQQNTIIGNRNGGLYYYSFGTNGLTLIQNLIAANVNTGIDVVGNGAPVTMVSNTIANNQPSCCGSAASEIQLDQFNAKTAIRNNLVVAMGEAPAFSCQSEVTTPVIANNDVFAAINSSYSGSCTDPTGTSGNISFDPLFVDSLSSVYLLQSGSPVINAGLNAVSGEPPKDMVGNARVLGGTIDIGANEYAATNALALSSYSLRFPSEQVGNSSSPKTITLTNNTASAVTLNLIATNLNFSQTNNCGASLAAAASCQVKVTFAPLTGGLVDGVLGIFTSATVNPLAVELVGTGLVPQIQFYANFYFYGQVIGTSNKQSGTLTNVGNAPLTISSITYSGASDFVESNTCPAAPNTLAAQASCAISVTYVPTILGQESGTITISANVIPASQNYYVNGSSVSAGKPTLSPTTLTFPTTLVGHSSASQTVILTNTGTGPFTITSIYSQGDFPETNNCPATLAVSASCKFTITYTPSQEGNEYGYLNIFNDSAYPASMQLTGTGQAAVPALTSLSIGSLPAGSQDTYIAVLGSGFVYGSQVLANGVPLPCCGYVTGNTQINVTIPASMLASAGTFEISVYTPAPGGGTSNSLPLVVYQPINYKYKAATYNYRTITGANLNLVSGSAQITSPFPIQFGGGSYTNLLVGEGGTVSFSNFANEYNTSIPNTDTPTLVAPFWTYLYAFGPSTGTDNNGFWEVTGSIPNRQLVIEWRDVSICCETTATVTFQVVFLEGNGEILFNYADTIFGGTYVGYDNGATATSGVQVTTGVGTQYSYDKPSLLSQTALLWYPSSPTATLSSTSLGFGYHQIGSKSLAQKVTLTNGGIAPLVISSIATGNPDFTLTSNCPTTLASLKSCNIQLFFSPSLPSAETATLTITDNASNTQTASLTGIGTITTTVVYPIMANFGSVTAGTTSTLPVVLANGGNIPLTIQSITASPSVYTETNNCGASLAAGASCTVNVTFAPVLTGNVAGTISMALNSKPAVAEVTLAGSGK
jgi:hypothetical protein